MKKNHIMQSMESILAPAIWRENLGIQESTATIPVYGEVKFRDGKLIHAMPGELPAGWESALRTDNEHHRVTDVYIGKAGRGIALHCAISHDPASGAIKEAWRNYAGARGYGDNHIYGGRWIAPAAANPREGYASMREALNHAAPDIRAAWDNLSVRERLRAIMASLKASAAIHGANDREAVRAMHAGGATCRDISKCRGGLHMAVEQNHAVIAIRALLNCGEELDRTDLARVERALVEL